MPRIVNEKECKPTPTDDKHTVCSLVRPYGVPDVWTTSVGTWTWCTMENCPQFDSLPHVDITTFGG